MVISISTGADMDSFNNLEYINISSFSRLLDDDSPAIIAEAFKIALAGEIYYHFY